MKTALSRYLFASDYDGTLFDTFSPSPNGIDVGKAYSLAIDDIFGQGKGEWFFAEIGLNGNTPSEVVNSILSSEQNTTLVNNAQSFYAKHEGNLGYQIPECANGQLSWNSENPEISITQMLVGQKLKYLLSEIGNRDETGRPWPTPCTDALLFLETVRNLKQEGFPVDFAIISSGHEAFIRKSLSVWNTLQPDVLVTEDDIRPRKYPQEPEIRFKPGVFPIALAHHKWIKKQMGDGWTPNIDGKESRKRIFYIGDDPKKDMQMAQHARVESFLYPQTSWQTIAEMLSGSKHLLDGRPFGEILRPQLVGGENFHRVRGAERM